MPLWRPAFPGSFPEESEVETTITPIREMYLISSDIEATRAELVDRGVDVSEPFQDLLHQCPTDQTALSIASSSSRCPLKLVIGQRQKESVKKSGVKPAQGAPPDSEIQSERSARCRVWLLCTPDLLTVSPIPGRTSWTAFLVGHNERV